MDISLFKKMLDYTSVLKGTKMLTFLTALENKNILEKLGLTFSLELILGQYKTDDRLH